MTHVRVVGIVPRGSDAARLAYWPAKLSGYASRRRCPMRVFNASITVDTEEGTEVADITKPVRDVIQDLPVTTGIALVNTLHTTCALFEIGRAHV